MLKNIQKFTCTPIHSIYVRVNFSERSASITRPLPMLGWEPGLSTIGLSRVRNQDVVLDVRLYERDWYCAHRRLQREIVAEISCQNWFMHDSMKVSYEFPLGNGGRLRNRTPKLYWTPLAPGQEEWNSAPRRSQHRRRTSWNVSYLSLAACWTEPMESNQATSVVAAGVLKAMSPYVRSRWRQGAIVELD
jgi:hypothetical protein